MNLGTISRLRESIRLLNEAYDDEVIYYLQKHANKYTKKHKDSAIYIQKVVYDHIEIQLLIFNNRDKKLSYNFHRLLYKRLGSSVHIEFIDELPPEPLSLLVSTHVNGITHEHHDE